jgi:hypothetical protein
MEQSLNDSSPEKDLISLESENRKLRKEVWILRVFAFLVFVVQLIDVLHKGN